jgi:hypothetical protein
MMMELEEKFGEPIAYVAALHADHAPHRHVHILAIVPFKLRRKDLELLRGRATVACWQQRRLLDLGLIRERERPYPFPRLASFPRRPSQARFTGHTRQPRYPSAPHLVLPDLNTCTCPRCSTLHIHHTRDPVHRCTSCGRLLHWQNRQKNLFLTRQEGVLEQRGKGLRWEL